MAVNPTFTILLDLYGEMLTEKERNALDLYYNEDLSLKEIADNEAVERMERRSLNDNSTERETITRQGVRDTIKRAEAKLLDYESKLKLAERASKINGILDQITEQAKLISDVNINHSCLREINEATTRIVSLAASLYE